MDMQKYSDENNGTRFILVVIDIFSKYIFLQPLKNKRGDEVSKAFKRIFQTRRKPKRLRTDKGK
jgi:hypothetical protein